MERWITLLLVLSGTAPTFSQPVEPAFHQLVCQQCHSWCSTARSPTRTAARIGKAGPRGPSGSRGKPGVVNMTIVEEMIDRKIHKGKTSGGRLMVRQNYRSKNINFQPSHYLARLYYSHFMWPAAILKRFPTPLEIDESSRGVTLGLKLI